MMWLKKWVKSLLWDLGVDVRYSSKHDALKVQRRLLTGTPVRTIVDAGAYHGEWTGQYRRAFPAADVYAFEPFPASQHVISRRFAGDSRVHLIPAAVGSTPGAQTMFANSHAATNSLKRVDRSVEGVLPDPTWVQSNSELSVPVLRLDEFCEDQGLDHVNLLKMDVQGSELDALRGAGKLTDRAAIDLIYTEMLFLPHYQGQAFHWELCGYLHSRGYQMIGLYNLFVHSSGRMLQADGIFASPKLWNTLSVSSLPNT